VSRERTGRLLRIYVDEEDRFHGKPLYMAIVDELRARGFTGATVLKGIEGYGSHKSVHAARVLDASAGSLPVVVEVVEDEARILDALPKLKEMIAEGLLTLENVQLTRVTRE
jgi:PII-like signaling protein